MIVPPFLRPAGRKGCLHRRVLTATHRAATWPQLSLFNLTTFTTMETAVWWKWVLSDSSAFPRKFCGHCSSGNEGRDVSPRMEPGLPAARWPATPGQAVRGQKREGLMLPAAGDVQAEGLDQWVRFRPAKTGGRTAAQVEETAEAKAWREASTRCGRDRVPWPGWHTGARGGSAEQVCLAQPWVGTRHCWVLLRTLGS